MAVDKDNPAVDVIIVGAGLAGLSAAYYLQKKDPKLKVLILEAKGRVGGRTLSTQIRCANGISTWDMGGQWVGSTQKHILELLSELGLSTFPQWVEGKKVMQFVDHGSTRTYSSFLPPVSWVALYHLSRFLYKTERMSQRIDREDPYNTDEAERWDAMTVSSYVDTLTTNKSVRKCLETAAGVAFGSQTSQIPLLYYLYYGKCAGSLQGLYETTQGGAQEMKIQGGAGQVCEILRDKIGEERVKLNSPVHRIEHNKSGVTVHTVTGRSYSAKRIIVAVPPQFAGNIVYAPALPEERRYFLAHMPMAHLNKFLITYEQAWWREAGYSGEAASDGGWSRDGLGPVSLVYDATDHKGNPALVGFYAGGQSVEWTQKPVDERKRAVLVHLEELFNNKSALSPIEIVEKFWYEEEYTGGCPVSIPHTGYMQHLQCALREPYAKIHWASTESATEWCGYMSGAVQAGERVAWEVLHKLNPSLLNQEELDGTGYAMMERRMAREARDRNKSAGYMGHFSHYARICVVPGVVALSCFMYVKYWGKRP